MIIALEEPATEEHSLLSGRFIKVILYHKRTKTYYKKALAKMIFHLKKMCKHNQKEWDIYRVVQKKFIIWSRGKVFKKFKISFDGFFVYIYSHLV